MAFKSGKLTGHDQSRIQRWALVYYQFSERRDREESENEVKKLLHLLLRATNDKLYFAAFPVPEVSDPDVIPGHTYGVDDLEAMEKLITRLGAASKKTQASLDQREWSEWR